MRHAFAIHITVVLSLLALWGRAAHADEPSPQELVGTARRLAAAGECGTVVVMARQVLARDPAVYDREVLPDPVVMACVTAGPLAAPAPAPAAVPRSAPSEMAATRGSPPSRSTALAWSLGVTAGGAAGILLGTSLASGGSFAPGALLAVAGGAAFVVGPTLGHAYAGRAWNPWLKTRLAGVSLSLLSLAIGAKCIDACTETKAVVTIGMFFAGAGAFAVGTIAEVVTAPDAVDEVRASQRIAVTLAPVSTSRGAPTPGLAVVGRF